jgi:hypothetical protein
MSTVAQIGMGTSLAYSAVPATTYTTLANITDITMPDPSAPDVKVTNYGTTGAHDFIAGFVDGGTIEVEKEYLPADAITLQGMLRTRKTWKVSLPDVSNFIFEGYINKISGAIPMEDKVTQKFTIKICTLPTISLT